MRNLVGYDRFEGEAVFRQLTELYRVVRLYVNFFRPALKLCSKQRTGGKVQRTSGPVRTSYRQVVASGVLTASTQAQLANLCHPLDPVRLLQQIRTLQDALWRHAVYSRRSTPGVAARLTLAAAVAFVGSASGLGEAAPATVAAPVMVRGTPRRADHKPLGPPAWRTRVDPFAAVWPEIERWLTADPTLPGTAVFRQLQQAYPARFSDGQPRTLQHRVHDWWLATIVTFQAPWLPPTAPGTAHGYQPPGSNAAADRIRTRAELARDARGQP